MDKLYILIKEEFDFYNIYGIYDDYLALENDYNNTIKYTDVNRADLHVYVVEKNIYYPCGDLKELSM